MAARWIALVTGANKGIGKEIARGLARAGQSVFLGVRDIARGEVAAADLRSDGEVKAIRLDVTSQETVSAAVREIEAAHGRLDVLVNNAGLNAIKRKPSEETVEEFRTVYETNVFGVVRVTNAFLPLLRRSTAGRIVNVTSLRGSISDDEEAWAGQPSMLYGSSKTALNALTAHYARELVGTAIKVFGAAPSHVATDFNNFRGKHTPQEGAAIAIRLATDAQGCVSGRNYNDTRELPW
jgi:NAD(P)-dependent dehydrogenase (short-subunit alcohol dehydrogenase family)